MTKSETWANARDIIVGLGLDEAVEAVALKQFGYLLAPKSNRGNRAAPIEVDGVTLYHCRYTDTFYPSSEMIYQNPEKRAALQDKGYSKVGISIWNKGQKALKDMKAKAVEIAFGDDQSDKTQAEGLRLYQAVKELEATGGLNDATYLVDNYLDENQELGLKID